MTNVLPRLRCGFFDAYAKLTSYQHEQTLARNGEREATGGSTFLAPDIFGEGNLVMLTQPGGTNAR